MTVRRSVSVALSLCAALAGQQPVAPVGLTVDALVAAQDAGQCTPAMAVVALAGADEEVARTAAAIVRHEWFELPAELFAGLDRKPLAARRLLEEFARAPRPAAAEWVAQQAAARDGRDVDHRLLALAARGTPLGKQEARLLLEALRAERTGDGFYLALPLLPEEIADGLLGHLHQGLLQQTYRAEQLVYLMDRLSPRGIKILLGLCVTLDVEVAEVLLRRVYDVQPELVHERVAAALDGDLPLDAIWLKYARHVLDRDTRVTRLIEVVRDDTSQARADRAFEALLAAGIADERMLAAALDGVDADLYESRVRRVLMKAVQTVPASRFALWIGDAGEIQKAAVKAVVRRPQCEPELQHALLSLLEGVEQAARGVVLDAVMALAQRGDAEALQRVWPLITGSSSWRDLLDRLGHREEPFVYQTLLADLVDGPADGVTETRDQQRDMLRLLLVGRGDRRELATLIAHAPARDAMFVRRCRHYARELTAADTRKLYDAALVADDVEVAAELFEWVASAGGDVAAELLWQFWQKPPITDDGEELLEIALRVLAHGPKRPQLVAQLRAQLVSGPLADLYESLPYELLNSIAQPAPVDDLRLCAELLLWPAMADPDGEQRRARRWPDGTFGFPMAAAIATRLRVADAQVAALAFDAVVTRLAADDRRAQISPQRLKVFWRALASHRHVQVPLGVATASLWSSDAAGDDVQQGAAWWLQARRAELAKDFAKAESLYRRAATDLLRRPDARQEARWLLGERDPMAGDDPWARLSTEVHRMQMLAARAAGHLAAEDDAILRVREFAGHDRQAIATIQ